jgi:hypothetical protein
MTLRSLILAFALCAGLAHGAGPVRDSSPVHVVSADFGVFVSGLARELVLETADVIPRQAGQYYGWVIEVRTRKRSLDVREEYVWPDAPGIDPRDEGPGGGTRSLRFPQRRQVSQRTLTPVDGRIYGAWLVGPDEPAGQRHLEVRIRNEVVSRAR